MRSLDRYTCEQTFERLDSYLDRELTPQEMQLVRQHLEICAQCATEFKYQWSVIVAMKERLQRIEAPETLLAKVSLALQRAQAERDGE